MAAVVPFPVRQPDIPNRQPDGDTAETSALISPIHPPQTEGVFDPADPESLDYRFTYPRDPNGITRRHDLLRVNLDDYLHVMWVTEPAEPQEDPMYVYFQPGLGETIEDGVGFDFHEALARYLPDAHIISHATHGIGHHGQALGWRDMFRYGLDEMAAENYELLQQYLSRKRLVLVGNSMGTVINNKTLQLNLVDEDPLDVAGVVNFASAQVDPRNVPRDMIGRFPLEMLADGIMEGVVRTKLGHHKGLLSTFLRSGMRWSDTLPIGMQIAHLVRGLPKEQIIEVVKAYPTATIIGAKCGVGQAAMWSAIKSEHPELILHLLKGRRHGVAFKPIDSARKVGKTVNELLIASTSGQQ